LIWSAYFTIPLVILKYVSKRQDIRFVRLYFLFASFILACGSTHFLDAAAFWFPAYRLNGLMRLITGILSWVTVYYLIRFLPIAFSLKSQTELEIEIEQRKIAEHKVIQLNEHLDKKILERTSEISDYKYALDESSIVAITDSKGVIKHVNTNFCKISKYSREELIGKDHRIINSGYHSKEFIRDLWTTISRGKIWKGELKNKAKDGGTYWVDTTIVPFVSALGIPHQYIAIRSDITNRKKAEEEQALLALIVNSSDDAIISINLESIITSWNRGAGVLFGYSQEEVLGKPVMVLIASERLEEDSRVIGRVAQGEYVKHYETEWIDKSGTAVHISLNASPIRNVEGNIVGSSKIIRNISERKSAEAKIRQSEHLYKTIASSIPGSLICLLDTDYRYILIEGDMLENLGYRKEELLGRKCGDVLSANRFADLIGDFKRVFQGETFNTEVKILEYDLTYRYVPLKDEKGMVYRAMIVAIDVTELKNAQRHINELNVALEQKVVRRTKELAMVNQELEAFTYSVSHDLRAPLRGIIGFAKMLEEDYASKMDREARRITSVITTNTLKMGRLIDDLLAFSRMGRQDIVKSKIDTEALVKDVISELLHHDPNSRIEWDIQDLPSIDGSIDIIRQVWTNLISNAIKYSGKKEQPRIEIGSFVHDGQRVFSIKDNGAGFDNKYKNKLFKVFQRLHRADEFEGSGVGLALVTKIISKHGGKVWAEGEVGIGACFYFSLPGS
jgi:PAS domain S-box-containing protein